ncbi:hypothetical protein WR25_08714 [Diploscapter pachys]|uniref:Uncharacterized protein n=1 Tax=Diploscapter pachys TaxID=2018661 RepID=A0A2A2L0G5_9BILA|nr:hypothetical protein WR25_08714 [Diploscapter pachys]
MRLFKETSNSPFFYWTIMSIVMQAHQDPALAQKMFLPLAQKMMTTHLVKTPYKYLQEIDLHLMVLEGLKQYKDCTALLQSDELQQFEHSRSQIIQKLLNLHIQSKNYDEVERITWTELEENPDDWYLWKCLVEVGYEKIVASENSNAEAVEFWQRTCDLADRKLAYRGPKMAKLYFLMKLRSGPEKTKNLDSAALAQGSPVYIMLAYIKQFFSKPTCFPDLRMFISMLNDEEKKALDNLMTLFVGDILSAEEAKEGDETQIWAIVLYEKMRRAMQLTDGMTREEKRKHIRHVMSQMMTNGLSDLAGGALTQLIAVVLWDEWKKNGDRQAAFELLLILEWSAIRFKADPFAKILLIKIYAYYGNLLRITALTKLLDIKSMQKEALGYLTFPLFEMSGRFKNLKDTFQVIDCVVSAYKNGGFAHVQPLVELADNMKWSMQAIAGDIFNRYLSGLFAIEQLDEAVNTLHGDEGDYDWKKLVDNRDFGIIPPFYAVDHTEYLAKIINYSKEEFLDHMKLCHYLCKAIASVGRVGKTSISQMHTAIGKFIEHHDHCKKTHQSEHELASDMHAPCPIRLSEWLHSAGLGALRNFLSALLNCQEDENSHETKLLNLEDLKKQLTEAVSIFDLPPSGQSIEPLSLHSHLFAASRALQALASMRILVEACKTRFGGKATPPNSYYQSAHEILRSSAKGLLARLAEIHSLLGQPGIVPQVGTDWGLTAMEILTEQSLAVETRFCKSYGSAIEQMQESISQIFA